MSISINGIPTSNISQLFVRDQLTSQLNSAQTNLYQLETEISTGHQFQAPSQDPQAAIQVMSIQSLLERYGQVQTNVTANQTYLSQTDSTLGTAANLLTSVQSTALGAIGSTASPSQRQAAVTQINQAVQELVSLGNTEVAGRQLFGGTETATPPFSIDGAGNVVYSGNASATQSYVGLNQLLNTSVTGDEAFGAMSQPIVGASFTPALSAGTPLADLNGGQGVAAGSIQISDGHSTSTVNLSSASTLGDVATLIEQNPPAGRRLDVQITPTGLTITLQPSAAFPMGDNLSVQEVGGNTTAADLGILTTGGVGAGPLVGQSLTAAVTPTTDLADLFASKASAYIDLGQPDSNIILQANSTGATASDGTLLNGVTVQFVGDAPAAGQESATFAPGTPALGNNPGTPGTLTVHISTSATSASRASQVVAAINNVFGLPFTASLDAADQDGGPQQPIAALPASTTTAGGGGTMFDTSGLQITSEGKSYTVNVSGDTTVQDLLNSINAAVPGMDAQINAAKTGISIQSRVSGSDFTIGENGGNTAAQLGIRTFTAATRLSQLNYGQGVGVNTATPGGTDFTISQTLPGNPPATVPVNVSIAGDASVGDVLNSINQAAQAAGATFRAQLATVGNGIELTDPDSSDGPIVVAASSQSTAAMDLGLVPSGQTSATAAAAPPAQASVSSGPNSELLFQAVDGGTAGNVQVIFQNNPNITEGNETVAYDAAAGTLTFQVSAQTTANDVIAALQNNPQASAAFTASLDTSADPTNDGSGVVQPQTVQMTGGQSIALTGSDVDPQETNSVFNALIKLSAALQNNDIPAIQRAMGLLSTGMQQLGYARDTLGVNEQGLTDINTQVSNEQVTLQTALSNNYDTDMASAVSQFTAAQISYQASLQATASLLQMSLMNYIPV